MKSLFMLTILLVLSILPVINLISLASNVRKTSFIEVDEVDNDDDMEINAKTEKSADEFTKLSFSELRQNKISKRKPYLRKNIKSLRKSKQNNIRGLKSKVKEIEKLMYNDRKINPNDKIRRKIFRINQINRLQSTHTWNQSKRESMEGKFSRAIASQGIKNTDPFVSYLGFLRDSSLKGNVNVMENEMKRFYS